MYSDRFSLPFLSGVLMAAAERNGTAKAAREQIQAMVAARKYQSLVTATLTRMLGKAQGLPQQPNAE